MALASVLDSALALIPGEPALALGAPFVCSPSIAYYSANNGSTTQLYTVSDATSPYTLTPIGSAAPIAYNGIGYDPANNYLYGLLNSQLLEIDSTGAYVNLGSITGLSGGNGDNGAFLPNGTFITVAGSKLYFINVATVSVVSSVAIGISPNDIAYDPATGDIYAVTSGGSSPNVTYVFSDTGTPITVLSQTTTSVNTNAGAQWFDANGNLFFGSTAGGFYQVNLITGDITKTSTGAAYSGIDAASCTNLPNGTLTTGPVGADATTGSYDGIVPANNNDDFTAVSFAPSSGSLVNGGTVPGFPVGNVLGAVTPFVVANSLTDTGAPAFGSTVLFTVVAPLGWTAQICPSLPSPAATGTCAAQTASTTAGYWSAVSGAAATATGTFTLPANVIAATGVVYYVRYYPPMGLTAFTRYDASITGVGPGNTNATHNELYSGFVPLTKTETTQTQGSCGSAPPANGGCPGSVLLYAIDYRNIMVGGASESSVPNALLHTAAGTLQIADNGAAGSNSWATNTSGLNDALVGGANGTTTYGDTTAGSTFSGGSVGSSSFTDTVGGSSFTLTASGTGGTSQGTIYFRVVVK